MHTIAVLLVLLALSQVPARADDNLPTLEFPAGQTFNLVEEGAGASVRIPVTLEAKVPAGLRTQIVDAVFLDGRAEKNATVFTLELDANEATRAPSLLVKTETLPPDPGQYLLRFRLAAADDRSKTLYDLHLQRTAAVLTVNSPLVIRQTWYFFGYKESSVATLIFTETSKTASAGPLSIFDCTPSSATQLGDGQRLQPVEPSPEVPASRMAQVAVQAVGEYPLGTTAGKLRVTAPQLVAPVDIDYQVVYCRTPFLIFALTLAGFGLGYFIRTYIQGIRDLDQARLACVDADIAIVDALRRYPDADFQRAVQEARANLLVATSGDVAATIITAAATAQTALQTALHNLQEAQTSFEATVNRVVTLVAKLPWELAPAVLELLGAAKSPLAVVATTLARHDVSSAKGLLDAMLNRQLVAVINASNDWQRQACEYLRALKASPPPLTDTEVAVLGADIDGWTQKYGVPGMAPTILAVDQFESLLQAGHEAYLVATKGLADLLPQRTLSVVGQLEAISQGFSLPQPAAITVLVEATGKAASLISKDLDDPIRGQSDYAARMAILRKKWLDGLTAQVSGDAQAVVRRDVESGKWTQVINDLTSLLPALNQAQTFSTNTMPSDLGTPQVVAPGFSKPTVVDYSITGSTAGGVAAALPFWSLATTRQRLRFRSEAIQWLQTAVFACLASAVTYVLYADHWVGTVQDMVAVFMVAFGTDITVNNALNAAKKLPVGGKPQIGTTA